MKKALIVFYLFIMISVLAACISIPIGDNVLEISSDGIDFVSGDDESDGDDHSENEASADNDSQNEGVAEQNDESENLNENKEEVEETTENEVANADDPVGQCEKQDHSEITDTVDVDLYIPE